MRTWAVAAALCLALVSWAKGESGGVQVTFHAKPDGWHAGSPHAFIEFQGVYRGEALVRRAFGFSFVEGPKGTFEYYELGASAILGKTAGTIRYESHEYVSNPANVTLTTFVDDETFDRMISEITNWRLNPPDYSLMAVNCVGFIDRLARIAGLDTPPWRQVFPSNYVRELLRRNKEKMVCTPPLAPGANADRVIDQWVASRLPLQRTDMPARLQREVLRGQLGIIDRIYWGIGEKAAQLERAFIGSQVLRRSLENEHNAMVRNISIADQERETRYVESMREGVKALSALPGTATRSFPEAGSTGNRKFPCFGPCLETDGEELMSRPLLVPGTSNPPVDAAVKIVVRPSDQSKSPPRTSLSLTGSGNRRMEGSVGIVDLGPRVVGEPAQVTFRMESKHDSPLVVAVFVEGVKLDEASIGTPGEKLGTEVRKLPRHVFMLAVDGKQEITVGLPPVHPASVPTPAPTNEAFVPPRMILVANGEVVAAVDFIYSLHGAESVDVVYKNERWISGYGGAFNEPPYSICSGEAPPNYSLVGYKFSLRGIDMKNARSCDESSDGTGDYAVCRTVRTPVETCTKFQVQGHHKGGFAPENGDVNFAVDVLWKYALVKRLPTFVRLQQEQAESKERPPQ